ncbi:aminopeptidase Ey-like [Tachysurus vachellii]|uniref:aminopeptidase Ey-like n=1 Tax=Tachysurus vachellii TaxID=175792 RepID=UPI00296AA382|nr:aminopeptidase Ey-like [Tachysurus vachellii]
MVKCRFSTMCIICTVVSILSVSIIIGLWTFQFLSFSNQTRSQTAGSDSCHPEHPLPVSYDITLWPRLKANAEGLYIFTGNSSMVFESVKETDLILIHVDKLNLTSEATLSTLTGSPAPSITSTSKATRKSQCLTFHLSEKLKAGERYKLHTEFVGELPEDLARFYMHEHEHGAKKTVVSQSTPHTHTPGIFLCCNKQKSKAVFHIRLLQERETTTISNTQQISV